MLVATSVASTSTADWLRPHTAAAKCGKLYEYVHKYDLYPRIDSYA